VSTLELIEEIILLIIAYEDRHPHHVSNCKHLIEKYTELKETIKQNSTKKDELIHWSIWFAPRLIFDGIGQKDILKKAEEINSHLK
jgi:hypothetical protein